MKITVLGSGSAYGVPYVGGCWGTCDPTNPKNRRMSPSIMVEENGTKILIDMSPDFKEQSITHKITDLDAVLYTHAHADHITGNFHLPKFMYYFKDKNLPLYATRRTRRDIERVWWFQNDPDIDVEYSGDGRPFWTEIVHFQKFKVNDVEVLPIPQLHNKLETTGFRFGKFAYSTDWKTMSDRSFDLLKDLDIWLVECDSETPTTMHQDLDLVLENIKRVNPKEAYLCHLNYTMDYDRVTAKLPPNVHLSYDGLTLNV